MTDFNRKVDFQIKRLKISLDRKVMTVQDSLDLAISQVPSSVLELKLGDLLKWQPDHGSKDANYSEANSLHLPKSSSSKTKRSTQTSDDGYLTGHSEKSTVAKLKKTASKVSSANKLKVPGSVIKVKRTSSRLSKKVLLDTQTPVSKKMLDPITPKICPNTPVNILRRPKNGETVLSMGGSPLMVSTTISLDSVANINLPLANGTVMSLVPNGNLRQSMIPSNLSPSTINQLRTLKGYIDNLIAD